jgi:hypothetical protein
MSDIDILAKLSRIIETHDFSEDADLDIVEPYINPTDSRFSKQKK